MGLGSNALQAGIYTRLDDQLTETVYDYVPPETTSFPYVTIGDGDTVIPWKSKTYDGQEFQLFVHTWDKGKGTKDTKTLLTSIYSALHQQESNITVTGFTVVSIEFEFEQIFQEDVEGGEGSYYHGVHRYRVLLQDT